MNAQVLINFCHECYLIYTSFCVVFNKFAISSNCKSDGYILALTQPFCYKTYTEKESLLR